jgi:ribosomal protein L11 methyltransferase
VGEEEVEDALDVLLPMIPQGVHERPAGEGRVELFWFGEPAGPVDGVATSDWNQRESSGRRDAEPVVVGGRIVVRASEAPPGPAGLPEVVIDAEQGQFGTGGHPTTMDSLELLLEVEPEGSFADLGCGAGVLAIVAARLGFAPVAAVDFMPGSVRVTAANAQQNGVAVSVAHADLLTDPAPPARTYAANMPLAVHEVVARDLAPEVATVIVSGIVAEEVGPALAAYAQAGLHPVRRRDGAGWASLRLERM